MRPAADPDADYKDLVRRGYDRCAPAYARARARASEPALAHLAGRLKPGSAVLDIGCGPGLPVALELARHHAVTGVDSSAAMIRLARENVPGARFVHGDIMAVDLPRTCFHAVVAFYSIFHLPREEHPALFARIHGWLRPGGYFLGTLSHAAEAPYLEDDFFGETMYWSNFGLADYLAQLQETGFICLMAGGVGHGYQAGHETPGESHPLVLAQKQA